VDKNAYPAEILDSALLALNRAAGLSAVVTAEPHFEDPGVDAVVDPN
jgi:hypothetical protein